MTYVERAIEDYLKSCRGDGRAIVIYGPRRAGKTTLARRLLAGYSAAQVTSYQTDDPSQAALFVPSVERLRSLIGDKRVIFIDEAQALENAGLVLKLIVDNFPDVQVIATGSSSFELSDKIKESMVGRANEITLLPFSAGELATDERSKRTFDLGRSLRLGSYPEVVLSDDAQAADRLSSIADNYLYKDILSLADTRNPAVLRKLLTALALQIGQEVSYNELATMLEISRPTVERYIHLLEQCFVVFRLDPLSSNPRKLLASRKRKVYFYDLGVRNLLAGQLDVPLAANPQLGGMFENFCVLERLKSRQNHRLRANSYYWRGPDSEIDYLEQSGNGLTAYEIKWNRIVKSPPPTFRTQFPDAAFATVTKDDFWQLIEAD